VIEMLDFLNMLPSQLAFAFGALFGLVLASFYYEERRGVARA